MKNNNNLVSAQLFEKRLKSGRVVVFSKINNFKLGEIDFTTSTFHSVTRRSKNVFQTLNGLGINSELLFHYDFNYIVIPIGGKLLKTTKVKWLSEGISLKSSNNRADHQIILPLSKINLDSPQKIKGNIISYSLFGGVAV